MKLKTVIPVPNVKSLSPAHRRQYTTMFLPKTAKLYLVDNELYVSEEGEADELLTHWSQLDIDDNDHAKKRFPLVRTNGEYAFMIMRTDDYETSAISLSDGKAFVVHDG